RRAVAVTARRLRARRSGCLPTCAKDMSRRKPPSATMAWCSSVKAMPGPSMTRRPPQGVRRNRSRCDMADATVKRTGVIGLGAMGLQMARHMVRKGFEVSGYDVDSVAAKKAASHGVRVCGSVAEVGKHAEVVMVMVATDKQIHDVVE